MNVARVLNRARTRMRTRIATLDNHGRRRKGGQSPGVNAVRAKRDGDPEGAEGTDAQYRPVPAPLPSPPPLPVD